MLFSSVLLGFLSGAATVLAQIDKRQTASISSIDISSILSQISVLTAAYGPVSSTISILYVTPGGNLQPPPATLVGAIMTAVPASVLIQLVQPAGRSSIAAEFQAGNTPAWYQTLPTGVKSYIAALETQIAAGGVNLSATPTIPVTGTASLPGIQELSTSTSKAWAAQATGPVGVNFVVVIGALGFMAAL